MVVAVAKALEAKRAGAHLRLDGNTAASAAAYGARAGVTTVCVVPHDSTASGKMAQTRMFGARVVAVTGTFDHALTIVRQLAEREGVILVNSVNPHRLEGQKTAAFEIVDALGDAPDELYLPVGNAGNIAAYWRGFAGLSESRTGDADSDAAGIPGRGRGADGARASHRRPRDPGVGHSHRQSS